MKLIIQIPAYNEEETLHQTLADLPRQIPGFDVIEWLLVDDGSHDRTAEVARANGVDHVVSLSRNRGLAYAFSSGIDAALRLGADVIVNTDADNQYSAADIPALCAPILSGRADYVIGNRQTSQIEHFSPTKKRLQWLGSFVVRSLSGTEVPDVTSGFRALSRAAALRINVLSDFTYTIESILQAGSLKLAVTHVPIRTNAKLRESRLFRNIPSYIARSLRTMGSITLLYRPLSVFAAGAALFAAAGLAVAGRFVYLFATDRGGGHVQSLVFAAICILIAGQLAVTGLLAHLIGHSRRLLEETLWRVRRIEVDMDAESNDRVGAPAPPVSARLSTRPQYRGERLSDLAKRVGD